MLEIFELKQKESLFEEAVGVFWREWGNQTNYQFYYDCMMFSGNPESDLPRFYIAVQNDSIVGTYALLRNDLVSRQDLYPWLACLYVVPELRGNKLGSILLQHAVEQASKRGFINLYLCTELNGYYEKYSWSCLTTGYMINGASTKIYTRPTNL